MLEVGSGTGDLYDHLAGRGLDEYFQADDNPHNNAVNAERHPQAEIVPVVDNRLQFEDGIFGMVVAQNLLDVARGGEAVMEEIRRVLEPGGTFVHFHDRRPNIGAMIAGLDESVIPFGWIDDEGLFRGLQLVQRADFDASTHPDVGRLAPYAYIIAQNPGYLEEARSGMFPQLVDIQSQMVEAVFADSRQLIGFGELYMRHAAEMVASAELELVDEAVVYDEATAPLTLVQSLVAMHSLGTGIPSTATGFRIDADGAYSFITDPGAEAGGDTMDVVGMLRYLVARKPVA